MADTIYSVDGGIVSTSANWMRQYRVRVYTHTADSPVITASTQEDYNKQFSQTQTGDEILDVSTLRCKFEIKRHALYYPNQAIITIYNLSASTETSIIEEGYRVIVEAGYNNTKSSNYGQIFDGTVIMCNRWKQSGTDYILQILALDSSQFINEGYCSFTIAKGQTARAVVENIVKKSGGAINDYYISPEFDEQKLTKGYIAQGSLKNTLSEIAKTYNGTWFVDNGKLYMLAYADSSNDLPLGNQAVELSIKNGLIGNPKQVNQGIEARCLLNPQIVPYSLIHISNELITEQLVDIGTYSEGITTPWLLDPHAIYRVISVTYTGDTRGNEWYTDITAVTQAGAVPEMLQQNVSYTLN